MLSAMDTHRTTRKSALRGKGMSQRMAIALASIAACALGAQVDGAHAAQPGHAARAAIRHDCSPLAATVVATVRSEARAACEAIARAADFLAGQGAPLRSPIELHLVDALPEAEASATRGGVYLHEERRAYVLRRGAWKPQTAPFGLPMTAALHDSVVVHEAAHAIAAQHFRLDAPDVVAHEYLAYVAQLASLAPALRERILEAFAPRPPIAHTRFNVFVLGMNPDRFAALAWLHWSQKGNGAAFVDSVLAGEVLHDSG